MSGALAQCPKCLSFEPCNCGFGDPKPTPDDTAAPDHYAPLREFLDAVLERASKGKGAERHADGKPFLEQPILANSRLLGSPDGLIYQIIKKGLESRGLEREAAMRECLDIAVYAAGMWCWYREEES